MVYLLLWDMVSRLFGIPPFIGHYQLKYKSSNLRGKQITLLNRPIDFWVKRSQAKTWILESLSLLLRGVFVPLGQVLLSLEQLIYCKYIDSQMIMSKGLIWNRHLFQQ